MEKKKKHILLLYEVVLNISAAQILPSRENRFKGFRGGNKNQQLSVA